MTLVSKRSEILFLYDVKRANPNGDPMDANRPRIDEETGKCMVTDVRLKRTVRDYLMDKGYDGKANDEKDIFIRDENDKPVTGKQRSEAYKDKDDFLRKFIDARLFGGVSAVEKKSFNLTGPVQFGMGKTLNVVKENFIKGTGAFATKEGAEQRTFREEYNITYGLVAFHGVINENAAKHTKLTETDVEELMDGLWNGTKNLLTRSKKGHMPRLLVKIDYKEPNFFIGDLAERLSLLPKDGKKEAEFEDIEDFNIDTSRLVAVLEKHDDKIANIYVEADERIQLSHPIKEK
jgi:CRISPR-associated protein Csh2